jgi:hypothetical protein
MWAWDAVVEEATREGYVTGSNSCSREARNFHAKKYHDFAVANFLIWNYLVGHMRQIDLSVADMS